MKKKNLSLVFGLRLGVEIIILISILAASTILLVKKGTERTFITSTTELIQAHIQGLSYRNSKFMQQLRAYTMSDPVLHGATSEELVDWMVSHRKMRSQGTQRILPAYYQRRLSYVQARTYTRMLSRTVLLQRRYPLR